VLGLLFGLLSPLVAIWQACKQEAGKWQTYVRKASAVSRGHQERIKMLARCVLVCECFQCSDTNNLRGKRLLLDYYKLGHHLGFSFHIIIITLIKFALFNPCWTACTSSLEELKEIDDRLSLSQGLLRSGEGHSGASIQRGGQSRNGRVILRSVGSHEPAVSYQVEYIQPTEHDKPPPYQPSSEDNRGWGEARYSGYGQDARQSGYRQKSYVPSKNEPIYSGKPLKSNTPEEAEEWGDWGAA